MKKIIIICTISVLTILIIVTIVFAGNYLFTRVLIRDNIGLRFNQKWVCSDYGICFTSDNLRFPYQPSRYIGYVKYKDIDTYVEVMVDGYGLCFGNYDGKFSVDNQKPDTDPEDFVEYVYGDLEYSSDIFKVKVTETNDEYSFLMDKVLVFEKSE